MADSVVETGEGNSRSLESGIRRRDGSQMDEAPYSYTALAAMKTLMLGQMKDSRTSAHLPEVDNDYRNG